MRITCPICGSRDLREFTPKSDACMATRPGPEATDQDWSAWMHNRDNPAGEIEELFYHGQGCGAWIIVRRNVATHEILGTRLAREASA